MMTRGRIGTVIVGTANVWAWLAAAAGCGSGTDSVAPEEASPVAVIRTVEAACADCIYHMKGVEACAPAVTIDGRPYLVTGIDLDVREQGLCDARRQALVAGHIDGDTFVAERFSLSP